jgi:hypothetical protein
VPTITKDPMMTKHTDKRKAFQEILQKLQKLVPHLGNENENERLVALKKINNLLSSQKLDWHDFLAVMFEQKESIADLFAKLFEKDAEALVRLGRVGATFFSSNAGPFADVVVNSHRETWSLSSNEFSDWLLHQFYIERKTAPPASTLKSALRTLGAHARFEGDHQEVHLRIAAVGERIYIDIGDPQWHAVEVEPSGWRVVDRAPVRFQRMSGMAALPLPQRGASINQLRPYLNLSDNNFILYVSALADALRPNVSHPIVYLAGEEGAAKSTAVTIFRSLTDPSNLPLRTLPGTVRDLFVNVNGAQVLAFDNISAISPAISDALCQIATGSGIGMRKLYTDTDVVLIGGNRSVVLNGLLNAITRSDLADRTVTMQLTKLAAEKQRAESEFKRAFEAERPQIFGALLDIVAHGLSRLPRVSISRLPRMADFALWGVACETAHAKPDAFLAALEAHAAEAIDVVIENDSVATAITAFMHDRLGNWTGTVTELLRELSMHDRAEARPSEWKSWPKDPAVFGKAIQRVKGALRKVGIEIVDNRALDRKRTRLLELKRIEVPPAQATDNGAADSTDGTDGAGSEVSAKIIALHGS